MAGGRGGRKRNTLAPLDCKVIRTVNVEHLTRECTAHVLYYNVQYTYCSISKDLRIPLFFYNFSDLHHLDADPDPVFYFDADSDPAFDFGADPDLTFHFGADTCPTFCIDADPAPHQSVAYL